MIEKTMKQLIEEHNQIAPRKVKSFHSRAEAIKRIEYWKNLYSTNKNQQPSEPVIEKKEEKTYTPKQLEAKLNLPAIVIRRKLRKQFPDLAKQGAWQITEEMVKCISSM